MWQFREMGRPEINQDPTAEDFFSVDALDSLADGLVREAIQNSLDAKLDSFTGPVRVRFFAPDDEDALSSTQSKRYLDGLWKHVESTDVIDRPPRRDDALTWLAVEDFGTRGLTGDFSAADDPPIGEKNDFFYFWRNVGRGKKEGSERGRWGLGKTMFPAASRLHSFFGLSKTNNGPLLLMGQSVLKIHRIGDVKHYPYGYYGNHDTDGFSLPVTDEFSTKRFSQTFQLERSDEPGLSVVIPFPRQDLKEVDLLRSIVLHYFYPILANELEVVTEIRGSLVEVNYETIRDVASRVLDDEASSYLGMLDLADYFLSIGRQNFIEARTHRSAQSPKWNEELLTPSTLEELTESLDAGSAISLKIPIHILPKSTEGHLAHFFLVIQRDESLDVPMDAFIRQGITINGVKSLREAGIRALVIAEDDRLAAFLGDSENPAHTLWQANSSKFKGKYLRGPSTLDFVKDAPMSLMRLLNKRAEMIDDKALRHIFPSDQSESQGKSKPAETSNDPTRTRPEKPSIPRGSPSIRIHNVAGGFRIGLTEKGKEKLPMRLRVRCAYDVAKGNPFKKWHPSDFCLDKHQEVDIAHGLIEETQDNRYRLLATGDEFHMQVIGFDTNRDLIVDARVEDASDA